ncbi:hypothetical protein [Qipengyuania oceanensis]|uniref:Uncharacterized protein n=1 Tax=Qipengyuania oceanensis TaxID=1463597 RepID=A0A844YEB1_9SPHN|nr:hypothetical protein [Qipengyuania oceanensis]MXO63436.1 hypothetical protein [Qipengyuania oceanensis]
MSNETGWITSKEFLSLWFADRKNHGNPEPRLRPGLKAGLFSARAAIAELKVRSSYGRPSQTETDWIVPSEVWKGTGENSYFDLRRDTYTSRAIGIGFAAIELNGLSFERGPLLEYAQVEPPSVAEASRSPDVGGRPLDSEKWNNLVAVLAAVLVHQDLKPNIKKGTLYAQLKDYASLVGAEIPGKTSALPALEKALFLADAAHNNGIPTLDINGNPLKD